MTTNITHRTFEEPAWKSKARARLIKEMLHAELPPVAPGEYVSPTSYLRRRQRQMAWAEFLLQQHFDWHLTINTNDPKLTEEEQYRALRLLDALLSREFCGKKWSRCPEASRPYVVSISEKAGLEIHYHVLHREPRDKSHAQHNWWRWGKDHSLEFGYWLTEHIQRRKIFPAGDAFVTPLSSPGVDATREFDTILYVVKKLSDFATKDAVTCWSEFRG